MSIKVDEQSGFTQAQWDKLAYHQDTALRQVLLQRRMPAFTLHDTISAPTPAIAYFDSHATTTRLVRVYVDTAGHLKSQCLLAEPDAQGSPNTWSSLSTLTTSANPAVQPVVTATNDTWWRIATLDTSWNPIVYFSTDGISWTYDSGFWTGSNLTGAISYQNSRPGHSTNSPIGGNNLGILDTSRRVWVGLGLINEIMYIALPINYQVTHILYIWHNQIWDSGVYYPYDFMGFDVQTFDDPTNYPGAAVYSNATLRHAVVATTTIPPYYTYTQSANGAPVATEETCGGIIAWVVHPPGRPVIGGDAGSTEPTATSYSFTPAVFGTHYPIEIFQPQWPYQYRTTPHMVTSSSQYSSNYYDQLVVAVQTSDSDHNLYDQSYFTQGIGYYTSRDGRNWSQIEYLPLTDLSGLAEFTLARCGDYLYALNGLTTYRSPVPTPFGTPHPDFSLDITQDVIGYDSEFSNMRQTHVQVDGTNGRAWVSNVINNAQSYDVLYKFGTTDGLALVSHETLDSFSNTQERPDEFYELVSRGALAYMSDRKRATDALQYDDMVRRVDVFAEINGVDNSGLGHMAVQSGSFGTDGTGHLLLTSNEQNGVAFSTFKDTYESGRIQATIQFPAGAPSLYTSTPPAGSFGGLCFRGVDKNNFLFAGWNYANSDTLPITIGVMAYGVRTDLYTAAWSPPTGTIPFAPSETYNFPVTAAIKGGSPFTLRVDYYYNLVSVAAVDPGGHLYYIIQAVIPGPNPPVTVPGYNKTYRLMTGGYAGVYGNFYSNQDSTSEITLTSKCSGNQIIFTVTNTGAVALDGTETYKVIDPLNNLLASGTISALAPGASQTITVTATTATLIISDSGQTITQTTQDCVAPPPLDYGGAHLWDFITSAWASDWSVLAAPDAGFGEPGYYTDYTAAWISSTGYHAHVNNSGSGFCNGLITLEQHLLVPTTIFTTYGSGPGCPYIAIDATDNYLGAGVQMGFFDSTHTMITYFNLGNYLGYSIWNAVHTVPNVSYIQLVVGTTGCSVGGFSGYGEIFLRKLQIGYSGVDGLHGGVPGAC